MANCLLKCIPSMKLNAERAWRSGWQRCPHGLFLCRASSLLTENARDEEAQTSSVLGDSGKQLYHRFGSQMKARRDDEYISLLV
ncbi:hypothetical protein KCP74_01870 [Salmonella enterica subsp. enterica]|nr:hypothetical protein KCP74_01870 [Salmonella enterica subsp. enterica]